MKALSFSLVSLAGAVAGLVCSVIAHAGAVPEAWVSDELASPRVVVPVAGSPVRGPADAPVTIVEFSDYSCPYCSDEERPLKMLLEAYPRQLKLVFKNYPLTDIHPEALRQALTAECAGAQGRFWQAHDRIILRAPQSAVREGLDQKKWTACVARGGNGQVKRDQKLADQLEVDSTPSLFVNGIRLSGAVGFDSLKALIDGELARLATGPAAGPARK